MILVGISTKKISKTHTIKINLMSKVDKAVVCQLLTSFKIAYRTSAKGKDTTPAKILDRSTELVIRDISLGTTKEIINKRFSLWGEIFQITLVVNAG